jgi:hypothetical protein
LHQGLGTKLAETAGDVRTQVAVDVAMASLARHVAIQDSSPNEIRALCARTQASQKQNTCCTAPTRPPEAIKTFARHAM